MIELTPFEQWCEDNHDFLQTNKVTPAVAEIIWDSAKTSISHDIARSIIDGKLKISVTF